jgi:hypothetical protein
MMYLNHLRFTVGVFVLVCLLTPAVAVLKVILPARESEGVWDALVGSVKDLRDEIYYK